MGETLVLIVAVAATLAVLLLCVPVLSFQMELWRVGRRHELSRDEARDFAMELPEVRKAIAMTLGPDASSREVNRLARESIIAAILRRRERHGRAPLGTASAYVAEAEPRPEDPPPRRPEPGVVTREDIIRSRSSKRQ